jgi:hypothetical protein
MIATHPTITTSASDTSTQLDLRPLLLAITFASIPDVCRP